MIVIKGLFISIGDKKKRRRRKVVIAGQAKDNTARSCDLEP